MSIDSWQANYVLKSLLQLPISGDSKLQTVFQDELLWEDSELINPLLEKNYYHAAMLRAPGFPRLSHTGGIQKNLLLSQDACLP